MSKGPPVLATTATPDPFDPAPESAPANSAAESTETPKIERDDPVGDEIRVGAGGPLIVPREEFDDEFDGGAELDIGPPGEPKVRKPGRREWVILKRDSELLTRLLLHKPKVDGFDVEHYCVAPHLRGPIIDELKPVRVFLYYGPKAKRFGLWVVNVTPENAWYESVHRLLKQPAEYFTTNEIRIWSDKADGRYRSAYKPATVTVTWPQETMEFLFGQALGPDRFITSADHPLYQDLIAGTELK